MLVCRSENFSKRCQSLNSNVNKFFFTAWTQMWVVPFQWKSHDSPLSLLLCYSADHTVEQENVRGLPLASSGFNSDFFLPKKETRLLKNVAPSSSMLARRRSSSLLMGFRQRAGDRFGLLSVPVSRREMHHHRRRRRRPTGRGDASGDIRTALTGAQAESSLRLLSAKLWLSGRSSSLLCDVLRLPL